MLIGPGDFRDKDPSVFLDHASCRCVKVAWRVLTCSLMAPLASRNFLARLQIPYLVSRGPFLFLIRRTSHSGTGLDHVTRVDQCMSMSRAVPTEDVQCLWDVHSCQVNPTRKGELLTRHACRLIPTCCRRGKRPGNRLSHNYANNLCEPDRIPPGTWICDVGQSPSCIFLNSVRDNSKRDNVECLDRSCRCWFQAVVKC